MHLGSNTVETPVKLQSDTLILIYNDSNSNLAASRLHKICR